MSLWWKWNKAGDFGLDSDEYIRSVLNKALGEDKASGLLNRILQSRDAELVSRV